MLHTTYQSFRTCGFRREDISCFPYISPCKTNDPRAGSLQAQVEFVAKCKLCLLLVGFVHFVAILKWGTLLYKSGLLLYKSGVCC